MVSHSLLWLNPARWHDLLLGLIIFEWQFQWHLVSCAVKVAHIALLMMITASEALPLCFCVHKYFSNNLWHFALNFSHMQNQRLLATNHWSKGQWSCHSPSGICIPWFCIPCVSQEMSCFGLYVNSCVRWGWSGLPWRENLQHSHQKPLKNTLHSHFSCLFYSIIMTCLP